MIHRWIIIRILLEAHSGGFDTVKAIHNTVGSFVVLFQNSHIIEHVCDVLCSTTLWYWHTYLLVLVSLDNEQLARSGTNCLESLAVSVGRQFFPDTWDSICHCVRNIYEATIPHDLLTWRPGDTPLGYSVSTMSVSSTHSTEALSSVATPVPTPVESAPVSTPSAETEKVVKVVTKALSEDRQQDSLPTAEEPVQTSTPSERIPAISDETVDHTGQEVSRDEQQGVIPHIEVQQPGNDEERPIASESPDKRQSPVPLIQAEQDNSEFNEVDSQLASATLLSTEAVSTRLDADQDVPEVSSDALSPAITMPEVAPQANGRHSSPSQEVGGA